MNEEHLPRHYQEARDYTLPSGKRLSEYDGDELRFYLMSFHRSLVNSNAASEALMWRWVCLEQVQTIIGLMLSGDCKDLYDELNAVTTKLQSKQSEKDA